MSALTKFTWDGKFDTYTRMLPIQNYVHSFFKGDLILSMITTDETVVNAFRVKIGQQFLRDSTGHIVLLSPKEKE